MLSNKLMKNGNHKLIPSISPKKSWEGLAGGLILSLAAGVGFGLSDPFGIGLTATVVISFFLSLGSLAGDLSESALKRAADIKDSGNWIPGMGGILDVVDSFIYNAPVLAVSLAAAGI
jgi:phosphatidate cytidylyltransferase